MFIVSILHGLTVTPEGMFGVQIDHIYFFNLCSCSFGEQFTYWSTYETTFSFCWHQCNFIFQPIQIHFI